MGPKVKTMGNRVQADKTGEIMIHMSPQHIFSLKKGPQSDYGIPIRRQGLTLIELMVALALSLLVIAIALIAVSAASSGLRATTGASQLNDSVMLVNNLLQRSVAQAGFQRLDKPALTREAYYSNFHKFPFPDIYGKSLATMETATKKISASDIQAFYKNNGDGGLAVKSSAKYDLLAIRYQVIPEQQKEDSGITAMLDICSGKQLTSDPYTNFSASDESEAHKPIYVFFVSSSNATNTNGDVLYCKAYNGVKDSNAVTTAVIDGVVGFKVLYGLFPKGTQDINGAPVIWKTANELNDPDWYYIKRLRIGMVLESPPGATNIDSAPTLYPLGERFSSASNTGSIIKNVDAGPGHSYREINFTVSVKNILLPTNQDTAGGS